MPSRPRVSNSVINGARHKLRTYYLEPGRLQSDKLRGYQPIEQGPPNASGIVRVKLPSGLLVDVTQEQYLSRPEVFIQTLAEDFWNLFELALVEFDKPTVALTLRTIMEQCYRKILKFSNLSPAEQRAVAAKSWALTHALMVRRASDLIYFDTNEDHSFTRWVRELNGRDLSSFQKIKTENYSTGAVTQAILGVYPNFYKTVTDHLDNLVYGDGTQRTEAEGLVIINNGFNGYVHGNTANISDMRHDLTDRNHVYRTRTLLASTGFQVMFLLNKHWLADDPTDLGNQTTYYKRMSPHIIRRLSR